MAFLSLRSYRPSFLTLASIRVKLAILVLILSLAGFSSAALANPGAARTASRVRRRAFMRSMDLSSVKGCDRPGAATEAGDRQIFYQKWERRVSGSGSVDHALTTDTARYD